MHTVPTDQQIKGRLLICPQRREAARERVISTWRCYGGEVLRLKSARDHLPIPLTSFAFYGGTEFCQDLAMRLSLRLPEPDPRLLCRLKERWLHRRVAVVSVASLCPSYFPIFIKPLRSDIFPSKVYRSLAEFKIKRGLLAHETPVLISEVIQLLYEARAFVCEGAVISITPYYRTMGPPTPPLMRQFLSEFIEQTRLPNVCTIDIGYTVDGDWVLIECNPIWAANPLGADLRDFIHCLAAVQPQPA